MSWIDDQLKRFGGLLGSNRGAMGGLFGANLFGSSPTNTLAPAPPDQMSTKPLDLAGMVDPKNTKYNQRPARDLQELLGLPYGYQPNNDPAGIQRPIQQPDDDLTTIYKQLLANLATGGNAGGGLTEAQIRQQVASKYDPQINRIKREEGIAKKRFNENKATIKALYDELERDYQSGLDSAMADYANDKDVEAARTQALQNRMSSNYDNVYSDMSGDFENLGIQDALDPSTQQLRDDMSYLNEVANVEGDSTQRLIAGQERANRDYYKQGGVLANMRGAEVTTDFLSQLEDYLSLREGDITDLEAARSNDIGALLAQVQAQKQQQQTDIWNRLLQLGNFGMDLRKLQMSGQQAQQPQQYNSGLLGASQWLSQSVGPQRGTALMGILQNVLQTQQVREGRFQTANNDIVNITPEQVVKLAMDEANKQGMTDAEKVALMNAVYAYYGRLQ